MRIKPALFIIALSLCAASVPAASLIWDPNQTDGVTPDGSGNWDTTATNTVWFNGTSDVAWSQTSTTSPTMGAVFGGADAAPGTYNITNDAGQIAITNLTVNNNGYTFYGPNAIY